MSEQVVLPKLTDKVTRTYDVGLRFCSPDRQERRALEKQANTIIKTLQEQAFSRLTPTRVELALQEVRANSKLRGTKGAAHLASQFEDRQNLSQVSYLHLLNRCETTIKTEVKAKFFQTLLKDNPLEAFEWLVYGRQPYLERKMANYFKIQGKYARDLVLGFRRRLDKQLEANYQLENLIKPFFPIELEQAIEKFSQKINKEFNLLDSLTSTQKQFQNKLNLLQSRKNAISHFLSNQLTDWFSPKPETPNGFWKYTKLLSQELKLFLRTTFGIKKYRKKHSYFSALRGIFMSALVLHYPQTTVQELLDSQNLLPQQLVTPPYEKTRQKHRNHHRLPLSLIMGAKYVIRREGNSRFLTEQARATGQIPILIKEDSRTVRWKDAIPAQIQIHPKLLEFLKKGAQLNVIILYAGSAPAYKIRCQLVLTGEDWMFLSKKEIQSQASSVNPQKLKAEILGVDINRLGEHMLTFSEPVSIPTDLLDLCHRYVDLEREQKRLSRRLTSIQTQSVVNSTSRNQQKFSKVRTSLNLLHQRRTRLLKEIHRACIRFESAVLLSYQTRVLGIENLQLTTIGTRGKLAKIIASLPDEKSLHVKAIVNAIHLSGSQILLISNPPYNTSRSPHLGCAGNPPGRPIRSPGNYDFAPCSGCQLSVNTHFNAAGTLVEITKQFLALG